MRGIHGWVLSCVFVYKQYLTILRGPPAAPSTVDSATCVDEDIWDPIRWSSVQFFEVGGEGAARQHAIQFDRER